MTIERRPWLGFFDPATGRREARMGLTIGKIYTVTNGRYCTDDGGTERTRPEDDWGPPLLARDELYMRLRNEAGLSHQHATEFLAECPGYTSILHALSNQPDTGHIMAALLVWVGKNESVYREAARRCGWDY